MSILQSSGSSSLAGSSSGVSLSLGSLNTPLQRNLFPVSSSAISQNQGGQLGSYAPVLPVTPMTGLLSRQGSVLQGITPVVAPLGAPFSNIGLIDEKLTESSHRTSPVVLSGIASSSSTGSPGTSGPTSPISFSLSSLSPQFLTQSLPLSYNPVTSQVGQLSKSSPISRDIAFDDLNGTSGVEEVIKYPLFKLIVDRAPLNNLILSEEVKESLLSLSRKGDDVQNSFYMKENTLRYRPKNAKRGVNSRANEMLRITTSYDDFLRDPTGLLLKGQSETIINFINKFIVLTSRQAVIRDEPVEVFNWSRFAKTPMSHQMIQQYAKKILLSNGLPLLESSVDRITSQIELGISGDLIKNDDIRVDRSGDGSTQISGINRLEFSPDNLLIYFRKISPGMKEPSVWTRPDGVSPAVSSQDLTNITDKGNRTAYLLPKSRNVTGLALSADLFQQHSGVPKSKETVSLLQPVSSVSLNIQQQPSDEDEEEEIPEEVDDIFGEEDEVEENLENEEVVDQ